MRILGSRFPGGFGEFVVVPIGGVYRVPEGLDLDVAVLTEPLAVAVHGVGLASSRNGPVALVLGGGTIGLLSTFVATQAGFDVTVAVRHPHQRRAAERLGIARVVDSDRGTLLDAASGRRPDRERLATLITHRVGLDEIDRGFALAADKRSGAIKVSVGMGQKL